MWSLVTQPDHDTAPDAVIRLLEECVDSALALLALLASMDDVSQREALVRLRLNGGDGAGLLEAIKLLMFCLSMRNVFITMYLNLMHCLVACVTFDGLHR